MMTFILIVLVMALAYAAIENFSLKAQSRHQKKEIEWLVEETDRQYSLLQERHESDRALLAKSEEEKAEIKSSLDNAYICLDLALSVPGARSTVKEHQS